MPDRVHDARRRRVHARGNRRIARRHRRPVESPAQSRGRQAPGSARRVRGGMEVMTDDRIDFGADDHDVPVNDAQFDAWIASVAPRLNAPNATPRGEMWKAIEAAANTARDAQAGRIPGVTPLRRHWKLMSVIAAALLIGVAIDRMSLRRA